MTQAELESYLELRRIHMMAPPADRLPFLMQDLLHWLRTTDQHPVVEFMLKMILDAVSSAGTPQVAPQVTPQVERLLQTPKRLERH